MMMEKPCPIEAAEEALALSSQIEVGEVPLDFDPGDVRWREILSTIARRYSNHETVLDQLLERLKRARMALSEDCHFLVTHPGEDPTETCGEFRLARHHLWEAALDASEKAYQRWLAKQALRRAAQQNG